MKKFNRVLAMLLAIITVLAVLPISVLADDWLNVDTDKTQAGNVTSTDITVTVDPHALLSYIQDGDVKGFLKGMSASGSLGDLMTKKELLAILPEDQIIDLAKSIIADIDAKALLACIDADKLLACVDTDGLISLLKDMDLKSYIKDIDVFMSYVNKNDIEAAVSYINTQKLIETYAAELTDLVMGLDAETLVNLVVDEKVLDLFSDDELFDMAISGVITNAAVLKTKLQAKLQNGDVTANQIVACLVNYTAAIQEIGVSNAVSAIPGGYKTLINYVTNFKGLVNSFDVKAIVKGILRDRVITDIIDAEGLIKAINIRAFVNKVDVKQLIKVVYAEGVDVAQELLSQLDLESYMMDVFSIVATMQETITEIELDGVVITTQNKDGYLKLLPTRLIDALENLVPTLNELANLDDSGKLFTASFAISYLDGEIEKTKEINFNFVLTAGTDMIRRAAAKVSHLLDKVGYIGLTDGKLVADVKVPSEFASVLRMALEAMADSSDPEMNALKNKVLAAYAAQPDDFVAFAKDLTLEEIIAVLEAIDPALFGKVYNKALASHYAKVLLSYVERVTGYDFSDNLEAQNLVNTLATIPTFEVFVEKLENVTGIEITNRLPAKVNGYLDHTVYDVIDKLGDVAGYDFDMQNLLKKAAASTDPFAYLYTAVVNKAENAGGVYNFVKRNAIRVVNRLLATKVGNVIADNCLMDFYAGNSTFVFAKSVTFDAREVVEKEFSKILNFVDARVSINEDKIEQMFGFAMDMILDGGKAEMTTGFDITVKVTNLYSVTFKNNNGVVVLKTLLPVGTNLSKMLDYSKYEGAQGWVNTKTGDLVYKMPAQDIVVKATVEGDIETEATTPEQIVPEVTTPEETTPAEPGETTPEETTPTEPGDTTPEETTPTDPEDTTPEETTPAEPEETTPEETDPDEPGEITPNVAIKDYEGAIVITTENNNTIVTIANNWNTFENGVEFELSKEFLSKIQGSLILAAAGAQKVTFSNTMLNTLVGAATGDVVTFSYKFNGSSATSGKETYEFAFGGVNAITNFGEGVHFVLPFAGKSGDDEKTFVYADGQEVLGVVANNQTVEFFAPHFSTYTIVNKYRVNVDTNTYDANGNLITDAPIAAISGVDGWYEAGETVTVTIAKQPLTGYEYIGTKVDGQLLTADTFTMPAKAVTLTNHAKAATYYVYYYVNGVLNNTLEYIVTDYITDSAAFIQTIVGYNPEGYKTEDGWYWFGQESIVLGQNVSLFRVNDTQTKVTVNFYVGSELKYTSGALSISDWRNGEFANLKYKVDTTISGYVWTYTTINGDVKLTELTLGMLMTSNGTINFYGVANDQTYYVFTDGNASADNTSALAGTEITVTVTSKPGHTAVIKVFETIDGTTRGDAVAVNGNKFTMPASNVIIIVEYTQVVVTYNYFTITVPAGSVLNATDLTTLASAPADMVLDKVEGTADGGLKLTYRYTGTFDEAAFLAEVELLLAAAQYAITWIVNGVAYNSEAEAMNAPLPEGAIIVGWTEMSANVKVAIIEYIVPEGTSTWLIVCIVLLVLLLLAVIVLVYVLHVTDKIDTSWLTKVCAAIVGAFFAFCMLLAKVTLKVLNFVGIKTEDILEELPEEEPVADIPAVILDFTITPEETTEEVVEETPVEEVPVEEDATILEVEEIPAEETPAEEATEEVVEEAVVEEAPAEEATEEVVEEAVVEEAPAEEATEEVVEEAVVEETPAEEATEEVVEETIAEETPVEEVASEEENQAE